MTATNSNVNIVQWFGNDIFSDLQAAASSRVNPALQVVAIRYLYTFCYQVRFYYSFDHMRSSVPATVHGGATGLSAAAVLEPPRVAGSRGVHLRCGALDRIICMRVGGSTTLMYAFAPPPHLPASIVKFAGSRLRTCSRSCLGFWVSSLPRSG